MIASGIYAITNLESGKTYIGSTKSFVERWKEHRKLLRHSVHFNLHLQHAWNKYGEDTFEFGVLEYLDNIEDLIRAEQFWMDKYSGKGKELYNIVLVAAAPMRGRKHTEESKRRIGRSHLGRKNTKETIQRMSDAARRRAPMTEETRCRMNEGRKPRPPATEETRLKLARASAKITEDQVRELRYLYSSGSGTVTEISRKLDISYYIVYDVVHYRSWKHVE